MKTALILAAWLVVPFTAFAQSTGNPAGLAPDTPGVNVSKPAPDHNNVQDQLFRRQFALGNRAEVELGKMAQSKAASAEVREFAKAMIDEHSKAGDGLARLNRGSKPEIPPGLDPEHQHVQNELKLLSGEAFDASYLAAQLQDHQRAANLLIWHLSYGQNETLKEYSKAQLPVVLHHLERAKILMAQLSQLPPGR